MRKGDELRARTFRFACDVVTLSDRLVDQSWSARILSRQLLKSGTSVGANLEEADAAHSRPDFVSKCTIALKEARETHYWLRLLMATKKLPEDCELSVECNEIVAILTTIVRKASGK